MLKDEPLAEAYIEAFQSMANDRKSGVADWTIVHGIINASEATRFGRLYRS
ncbi:hypothetical protein RMSM_00655 [Rhodopirellula maiorica SM1]|uniref:Uncharacterized protein n=1 Tax=Rhodopirellula maiorica SM1 TaxID=1265738 RepID=M5RSW1_9BACT|nr:hypothetical protein [Rhodopirellula maiorica]EMI22428.1 hypothetical protein RMSM_00655 [Rhodopirellula maiorica SM1]